MGAKVQSLTKILHLQEGGGTEKIENLLSSVGILEKNQNLSALQKHTDRITFDFLKVCLKSIILINFKIVFFPLLRCIDLHFLRVQFL